MDPIATLDSPSRQWWMIGSVAAILIACVGAYHNSFSVPELLDDPSAISSNPSIQQRWSFGDALRPPPSSGTGGRPLANFTFALNYWWQGRDLRTYHALNLLIHFGAALTLFGLVRRTLRGLAGDRDHAWQSGSAPQFAAGATPLALAIALLWAVHPVLTNCVTYLSQRTESLMALCYLFTLYAYIRGARENAWRSWFPMSVAACLAGMASKEVMATAPLVVLLYDRTFVSGSFASALRRRWEYYLCLAATWLFLAVVLTTDLHKRNVGFGLGVEWWRYALTECQALLIYLGLGAWPYPLVFDRGVNFLSGAAAVPFVLVAALILVATVLAVRFRAKTGFLAAWFLIILAPTSSVVPIALQPVAENRLYLPVVAVVVAMVLLLYAALGRRGFVLLVLAGIPWLVLCERRNEDYQSALRLWADTVAKRPDNPRARDNYAQVLQKARRYDDALAQFQKALELNPRSHATYGLLGSFFVEIDRPEEAAIAYRRAIELKPDVALFHSNLGTCLNRLGRLDEAIAQCREAIRIDDTFAAAHSNLGHALYRANRLEEAARAFFNAHQLNPRDSEARYNQGLMLFLLGRHAEAVDPLGEAVRQRPGNANWRNTYAVALMELQRLEEARLQLEEALRLDSANVQARNNLERIRAVTASPTPSSPR